MRPVLRKLQHHFSVVRAVATEHVVRSFAADHKLVYFGSVDQHEDEHRLVSGVTLSKDHRDRHYCVGNLDGSDVIVVQRTDTLRYPHHPPRHYTWLIMQFDMRVPEHTFQHLLIDAHHHDETFYNTLAFKFGKLRHIEAAYFAGHEPDFINGYHIMAETASHPQLPYILRPDITATLAQHFKNLDFEVHGDRLIVYSSNTVATRHTLDHMAKAGIWLTECLEAAAADPHFPN